MSDKPYFFRFSMIINDTLGVDFPLSCPPHNKFLNFHVTFQRNPLWTRKEVELEVWSTISTCFGASLAGMSIV